MNSHIVNHFMKQDNLSDDEWIVQIQDEEEAAIMPDFPPAHNDKMLYATAEQMYGGNGDEIDALPVGEAQDMMTAFDLGALDAECGVPFAPEMFFVRHADKSEYAKGWASIKGESYLTDEWLAARLEEQVDGREDNEWFARGQW